MDVSRTLCRASDPERVISSPPRGQSDADAEGNERTARRGRDGGVPSGAPVRKKRRNRGERTLSDEVLDQLLAHVEQPKDLLGPESDAAADGPVGGADAGCRADRAPRLRAKRGAAGLERSERLDPQDAADGTGKVDVEIPRDRDGTFEPQVIPKHQRRFEDSTSGSWRCTAGG